MSFKVTRSRKGQTKNFRFGRFDRGESALSGQFFFGRHLLGNYPGSENYKYCLLCLCVVFIITAKHRSCRWCKRGRSENLVQCEKSESAPPVGWSRAELYSGTLRWNNTRGQNYAYFQNNGFHSFKSIRDETLYQELPSHTYTHTHTYNSPI